MYYGDDKLMDASLRSKIMREVLCRKMQADLLSLFQPFGLLDISIEISDANIREITIKIPFSKRNNNQSYKFQGKDQIDFLKERGYKTNLIWADKEQGQILVLIMEKQI